MFFIDFHSAELFCRRMQKRAHPPSRDCVRVFRVAAPRRTLARPAVVDRLDEAEVEHSDAVLGVERGVELREDAPELVAVRQVLEAWSHNPFPLKAGEKSIGICSSQF